MTHHVDLTGIVLKAGGHDRPRKGTAPSELELCVMEAVAYFAGEPHSDRPKCASPVITSFAMALNDRWDNDARQRLVPFIPRIVGTRDPALEETRRYLVVDWAVRRLAPRWLRKAGLDDHAATLEALPELTDPAVVRSAQRVIDDARSAAWTKRNEAKARIRAAVTEELKKKGVEPAAADAVAVAAADADAAADAVAVAAADADAAADAVAVAVAAAAADADAVAVAAAAAAADAAADAVAVAAADADAAADAVAVAAAVAAAAAAAADRRWAVYDAAYAAAYKVFRERWKGLQAEAIAELQQEALDLLERLIEAKVAVPA